jgi:hypothetical protein
MITACPPGRTKRSGGELWVKRPVRIQKTIEKAPRVEVLHDSIRVGEVTLLKAQVFVDMNTAKNRSKTLSTPPNWRAEVVWKPLRHFGRFYFQSLHLRVSDTAGQWFFNDYFNNNADAQWFRIYWPSQLPINDFETLHTTPPHGPQYVPGEIPESNSLHDTLFTSEQIRYSSKFGGSVALVFRSLEDYEYDLRGKEVEVESLPNGQKVVESKVWDFSSIEMAIHVHPRPDAFNRQYAYNRVPTTANVILTPTDPVGYTLRRKVSAMGHELSRDIFPSTDPSEELAKELRVALKQVALGLGNSGSICRTAAQFLHGYIHSEFQGEISDTHFVDMIELSDDYIDLHSHAKIPIFYIQLRLSRINYDPLADLLGINISAEIAAQHIYCVDCDNPVVTRNFHDIGNNEGTPLQPYGAFRLDQCDELEGIIASVRIRENDPGPFDDIYEPVLFNVPFDCDTLRSRYNNGDNPQLGLVEAPVTQVGDICGESESDGTIWACYDYAGTFDFESRVLLYER